MVQSLPNTCEALGLIPSTEKVKINKSFWKRVRTMNLALHFRIPQLGLHNSSLESSSLGLGIAPLGMSVHCVWKLSTATKWM
jgi:hypothetical protein